MNRFDERVLNGMSVFAAIVDAGSFAAAGARLDMSQSGVSRCIARLESRLGIRLFDRTTRAVSLTDDGRRLHAQILPLLAGIEEAASTAAGGATAVRGRLRVNVDPFFLRLILGPRLGAFLESHPDLQLEMVTLDKLDDLVAGGFDLAVRFGEPGVSSLVARKLLDTRIVTVASPSYLKRRGRPLAPIDLAREAHDCIHFQDPRSGRPFTWEFHRKRRKVEVPVLGRLTVNDVGTMHNACVAGYGIAQVMELGAESLLADGELVDIFPDWPDERFPLYALHPSRHHPPAKTRAFLNFVAAVTAGRAARFEVDSRVTAQRQIISPAGVKKGQP